MVREELLEQETAKRILVNQLSQRRLSHAYLFMGPTGVGKRAAARVFAAAINCPRRTSACACPDCSANGLQQLDVQVISPSGSTIKLQQVKDLIALAALTPNQGKYRVFIIEEAERLTKEAANALLLTLEEPKAFAIFILTASSPVLATIASRCQVIQFHQPRHSGQTDVRSDETGPAARTRVIQLLLKAVQAPLLERSKLTEEIEALEEELGLFLATLLNILRDLLVWAASGNPALLANPTVAEQFRLFFPADAASLAERCRLVVNVERMFSAHVNRRLLCEHLLSSL